MTAFQKSLARSIPPQPIAWPGLIHASAAAKPVDSPLFGHISSRFTTAESNKLIVTCLGAASAILIGTALLGVSLQDNAASRPFVDKSQAEKILAAAGVLPQVHDIVLEPTRTPIVTMTATMPVSTLTSVTASTTPTTTQPVVANPTVVDVSESIHRITQPETVPAPQVMQTMTQKLNAFVAQGKYEDAIVVAYGEAPKLSGRDNEVRRGELLTWLHTQETSGKMPVLFTIARLHGSSDNIESAAKWYMAASITGLLDVARCQDPEAAKAVKQLEEQFTDVRSYLKADAALRKSAVKFALDVEERLKNREPATWIAAHTTSTTGSAFITDVEWQARREQYRKALQGYVESK